MKRALPGQDELPARQERDLRKVMTKRAKPRYLCKGCGVYYGPPGKTEFGFCKGCWELHLSTMRRHNRIAYVKHAEQRGETPEWNFEASL